MFKKLTENDSFSLVELLIYIAIFGAVSGIAVGILTTVTKTQIQESALTDVSGQIGFVTQTIQRLVTDSSLVDMTAGNASSTLNLRMPNLVNDPTLVYLQNGQIYVQQGTNPAQSITSSDVNVDSLQFKKISQAPGKDTVQIDIAISAIQQAAGRTITRALRTAVARVNAAEFDSNLLPNSDNSLDIGAITPRWKSGYFSQGVTMATVSGNVGIGTASPSYKLDISGTFRATATSTFSNNVGIGTATPSYKLQVVSTNTENVGENLISVESSVVGNNSIRIKNNSAGGKEYILATTGTNHSYGSGGFMIFDNSSSSPRIFINSLGNIGIGTADPTTAGIVVTTDVNEAAIDVSGHNIIGLPNTPSASSSAVNQAYVDAAVLSAGGDSLSVYKSDGTTLLGEYTGLNMNPVTKYVGAATTTPSGCDKITYTPESTHQYTEFIDGDCSSSVSGASTRSLWYDGDNCTGLASMSAIVTANYNYGQWITTGGAMAWKTLYYYRHSTTGVCTYLNQAASYYYVTATVTRACGVGVSPCIIK